MTRTTKFRFRAVLALAVMLSFGGVLVAAFGTEDVDDGGRGGSLAVALSFVVLFLSRGYGNRVYDILTEEASAVKEHLSKLKSDGVNSSVSVNTKQKVDALTSKTKIESEIQETQNYYLALSSGIGTLMWGFGDIAAGLLISS